jgi:hypothetical protein
MGGAGRRGRNRGVAPTRSIQADGCHVGREAERGDRHRHMRPAQRPFGSIADRGNGLARSSVTTAVDDARRSEAALSHFN